MQAKMDVRQESESFLQPSPKSNLEQRLIEQFLADKGYTTADWRALPPEPAKQLMVEACQYAALKLAEIESTAHLWAEIESDDNSRIDL
jgi:hypothetical protein